MFKKIRNRILILNMAMVSAVVLIAFAFLYASAYTKVQIENRDKLFAAASPVTVTSTFVGASGDYLIESVPEGEGVMFSGVARRAMPGEAVSFSVFVDEQKNVREVSSLVDLPASAYITAASEALVQGGATQTVHLAGRVWQYAVDQSALIASGETGYSAIRFVDVTESHEMVRSLAFMLLGLMAVVLAAFFFISLFFANRAVRPMELAWERQGRFVADASHELKTPLSIISANCSALYAAGGERVDSQLKWVDSISRAAERMAGLTHGLLSLAALEDSPEQDAALPVNVSETANECIEEIAAAAGEKNLELSAEIGEEISISSGGGRVLQIMRILLDNAVKYTPDGGRIWARLEREKRGVVFSVCNSGEGISADDLPRVFDRFFRADCSRTGKNGGSFGLGLAIAQSAAASIGARLTAESVPGEFTRFSLRLRAR